MDKIFMDEANKLALKALRNNEIPIGAVIVRNNEIIAAGCNNRESSKQITGHAEINAINMACRNLDSWKLNDCELYVTVEPCLMCYGAIGQSRIKQVYIGSYQDVSKAFSYRKFIIESKVKISEQLVNDVSKELMQNFFKAKRYKEK